MKFWCNWQMRQSLHPFVLLTGALVCSDSMRAVVPLSAERTRP